MDLEQAKKFIKKYQDGHRKFVEQARTGRAYYVNYNDIITWTGIADIKLKLAQAENPLRNADFRIPHNWHQLLVNQKSAYIFTYPPTFDSGDDALNDRIMEVLGDRFARECKDLAIEASNAGVAWLHCWVDDKGVFKFADVSADQVIPVYGEDLDEELMAVLRTYRTQDDNAEIVTKYEIWTNTEAAFYESRGNHGISMMPLDESGTNIITHDMGYVPFVPFYNNSTRSGDITMYKELIDQYDLVVSGYANDLQDIQEIIFVIRNYGGEDLNTFLSELKQYKAIKVDGDSISSGGVETMKIEIPVDARVKFLEILKRQIFISGQGVDPDPDNFGNASGVALKYLYSLLEIKAGLLETEFRVGFGQLLRMILHYLNVSEDTKISQTFIRNTISNDLETAQIAQASAGIISEKSILMNHPWVEDVEMEMEQLKEERAEEPDNYGQQVGPIEGGEDGDE